MAKQVSWERALVDGYEPLKIAQKVFRLLPHEPRCRMCHNPFAGAGGRLCGWLGRTPSRKNPNLCSKCWDVMPDGGDAVNVAARLQSHAQDGQVVLSAELYDLVEDDHAGGVRSRIDVRGREEPVDVAVLTP